MYTYIYIYIGESPLSERWPRKPVMAPKLPKIGHINITDFNMYY